MYELLESHPTSAFGYNAPNAVVSQQMSRYRADPMVARDGRMLLASTANTNSGGYTHELRSDPTTMAQGTLNDGIEFQGQNLYQNSIYEGNNNNNNSTTGNNIEHHAAHQHLMYGHYDQHSVGESLQNATSICHESLIPQPATATVTTSRMDFN